MREAWSGRTTRAGLACLLAAAAGAALARDAAAREVDRVVAVVGREAITQSDVDRAASMVERTRPDAAAWDAQRIRERVLEDLIDRHVVRAHMKTLDLSVSDAEVNRALADMLRQGGLDPNDIDALLAREGVSKTEYLERLRSELERRKLIELEVRPRVVVSEEEIERYYTEHRADYEQPASVRLRALTVPLPEGADEGAREAALQKARDLRAMAGSGVPFEELVRQHSSGPRADEGGELGTFAPGELKPELEAVVFAMQPGEITEPMPVEGGFQLVEVAEVRPAGVRPLDEVRAAIREELLGGALEATYRRWLERIRQQVHVERRLPDGTAVTEPAGG